MTVARAVTHAERHEAARYGGEQLTVEAHRRVAPFAVGAQGPCPQIERRFRGSRGFLANLFQDPFRPRLLPGGPIPVRDHVPPAGNRMARGLARARLEGPGLAVHSNAHERAGRVGALLEKLERPIETSRDRG